ncbi:MAG: two-component sensor histidine kinase [Deltaproteobacteria bacterium]|nr:two-component sensor histidine kinase [Deltaproteobacteria bacterium]MBW2016501.1 two-component sensor histidine kinase [Deltaproteobacteria bacterium]MBW2128505.1 two-component sensor histidine kinase [Deltaproteobacteria bacterium]MBW2303636.1 two-component sensor histidine kinase [Deltaproteobacteria bacterium]
MNSDYYRSLARNMFLIIIIVSFTPMILASGILIYEFNISYHEKVYAHLKELVQKHKQNIDSFLREKLGDIRSMAKTFSYEEMMDQSFLRDRLETLQTEYAPVFVDLGVINARGVQVAYAGPFKLRKALYYNADWFQKAMRREYFISDVFLGLRGLPHFIIAVRENWKGEHWILRATIDFGAFNNLVENIRIGETGFAFILNRQGEFQTKPLLEIVPRKGPYIDLLKSWKKNKDDISIIERPDDSGNKNIYVVAFLKNGDWLLVYQQNASDAFSDYHKALKMTFAIIMLGGIAIITMSFILSRTMVNRIAKVDREKQMMNDQVVEAGKLASVGELAAGIAHEINNPVAIMVEEAGWIEDLLEDEEFHDSENYNEFKRSLKQIHVQGMRCKEITHKLLSFARKTDSTIQDVKVNDLIEEVVSLSSQRARYSNVTINTDLQRDLPSIRMSISELQQVLLNLINNALDAMENAGGSIDVRTRLKGDYIEIEVSDNGPGIPKANLTRIFDPFFTTKPIGKGTGLGLSICYGIIKKLGGEIEVHSIVEVGTTFHVCIPIAKDSNI